MNQKDDRKLRAEYFVNILENLIEFKIREMDPNAQAGDYLTLNETKRDLVKLMLEYGMFH